MRSPAFHRPMSLLALAAALLLLLVPTVGRLLSSNAGSSNAGSADGMWAQMCTAAGLAWVPLDQAPAPSPDPRATHGGHPPAGADCDYCPLLASLLVVALSILLARVRTPASRRAPRRPSPLARRYPCGLGSRGPPLLA